MFVKTYSSNAPRKAVVTSIHTSPKRVVSVESYGSFQKKVARVRVVVGLLLFTSPIWATYMVKALVN